MADYLKIGDKTYKKLVTFNDCASTGGNLFPWAFMQKKSNFSAYTNNYPYTNGIEEITSDKCIDNYILLTGAIDSKTVYSNTTVGSITYKRCVNKDDLKFSTDSSRQIPVKMHGVESGVTNDVYGRLYRDSTNIAEIMYTRSGNDNWVTKDEYIDLPSTNNQTIKVQNYKVTSNKAGYHFYFYISDTYDGSDHEYGYHREENNANGFTTNYMPLHSGNVSNYTKFYNICRIAKQDGKYIKVTYKCNS